MPPFVFVLPSSKLLVERGMAGGISAAAAVAPVHCVFFLRLRSSLSGWLNTVHTQGSRKARIEGRKEGRKEGRNVRRCCFDRSFVRSFVRSPSVFASLPSHVLPLLLSFFLLRGLLLSFLPSSSTPSRNTHLRI